MILVTLFDKTYIFYTSPHTFIMVTNLQQKNTYGKSELKKNVTKTHGLHKHNSNIRFYHSNKKNIILKTFKSAVFAVAHNL